MRATRRFGSALLLIGAAIAPSCATVGGTAASPITGGVDAVVTHSSSDQWYWAPFVFVGGTIAAPFVAFYNGINYDASHLAGSAGYWIDFDKNFRPYGMLRSET